MKTLIILLAFVAATVAANASQTQVCSQQRAMLVEPTTGECVFANDGCEIADYRNANFKLATVEQCMADIDSDSNADNQTDGKLCLAVQVPMVNKKTGECVLAQDGCEANALVAKDFIVSAEDCQIK